MGMIGWIVTVGMTWALLVGIAVVMAVAMRLNLCRQFGMAGRFGRSERDRIVRGGTADR